MNLPVIAAKYWGHCFVRVFFSILPANKKKKKKKHWEVQSFIASHEEDRKFNYDIALGPTSSDCERKTRALEFLYTRLLSAKLIGRKEDV